jgi:hypothetical protein
VQADKQGEFEPEVCDAGGADSVKLTKAKQDPNLEV